MATKNVQHSATSDTCPTCQGTSLTPEQVEALIDKKIKAYVKANGLQKQPDAKSAKKIESRNVYVSSQSNTEKRKPLFYAGSNGYRDPLHH